MQAEQIEQMIEREAAWPTERQRHGYDDDEEVVLPAILAHPVAVLAGDLGNGDYQARSDQE